MIPDLPVTQRLAYLTDTRLTQLDAVVTSIANDGSLVVDPCIFHPQGGGQPADVGWVADLAVQPVKDHATGLVVLRPEDGGGHEDWSVGDSVTTTVDRATRLRHAALHTTGHLIEAAGRSLGWDLAGNNHFPGQARVEFTPDTHDEQPAPLVDTETAAAHLRDFIAAAIDQDLEVSAATDADGRRTVSIGVIHTAPCGGTHVASLAHLADIDLTVKAKKGRIRVSYAAAHRDRA